MSFFFFPFSDNVCRISLLRVVKCCDCVVNCYRHGAGLVSDPYPICGTVKAAVATEGALISSFIGEITGEDLD